MRMTVSVITKTNQQSVFKQTEISPEEKCAAVS